MDNNLPMYVPAPVAGLVCWASLGSEPTSDLSCVVAGLGESKGKWKSCLTKSQ